MGVVMADRLMRDDEFLFAIELQPRYFLLCERREALRIVTTHSVTAV